MSHGCVNLGNNLLDGNHCVSPRKLTCVLVKATGGICQRGKYFKDSNSKQFWKKYLQAKNKS